MMYDILLVKERDSKGSAADMGNIQYTLAGHRKCQKNMSLLLFLNLGRFMEWKTNVCLASIYKHDKSVLAYSWYMVTSFLSVPKC